MDYERKYKEALEWMQSLYSGLHGATKEEAEKYFPELKDSEDERIVKCLLNYFNHVCYNGLDLKGTDVDEVIAWLEKQKPTDKSTPKFKIQDAKDGDVLVNGSNIFIFHFLNGTRLMGYCHVNIDNGRFYDDVGKNECFCLIDGIVTPATKEQRDLLFQQMKEAGYEWDADKKELKKIEVKTIDADKVIAWLNENVADFWANPCNPQNVINQFKKDFGL